MRGELEEVIRIENLVKSFGKHEVLKNINLNISKGEVISIIGPSGSGKSTLLRCINLLEIPTKGKIFINDNEITSPKSNVLKMRQNIGMVFQQFNLFPHMTVIDNMTFAPVNVKKLSYDEAYQKSIELLIQVGLKEKENVFPRTLSGGQKQRVAIARALAMEPEIMLFDEPTSALDPEMIKEVLFVIQDLVKTGITMALVTHEMGFARKVCDRICFLDEGQIIEDSAPELFFTKPKSARANEFLQKVL